MFITAFILQTFTLLYLSFEDLRRLSVSITALIVLCLVTLLPYALTGNFPDTYATIILLGALLALKGFGRLLLGKTALGLGDILIISLLSLSLTPLQTAYLLCLSGFFGVLFALFVRRIHKGPIPFVPVITVAYLTLIGLSFLTS